MPAADPGCCISNARKREAAILALKCFVGSYARTGYFASQYARAVEAVTSPKVGILVTGDYQAVSTQEMLRTAWKAVIPGKTVTPALRSAGAVTGCLR